MPTALLKNKKYRNINEKEEIMLFEIKIMLLIKINIFTDIFRRIKLLKIIITKL